MFVIEEIDIYRRDEFDKSIEVVCGNWNRVLGFRLEFFFFIKCWCFGCVVFRDESRWWLYYYGMWVLVLCYFDFVGVV